MEDIIKQLKDAGFTPEVNTDSSFKPITGKYVCRIDSAGRVKGTSKKTGKDFDFYSINLQITEVIEGDKGVNRFIKLNYNSDAEGMKKLLNDLFTADIKLGAESQEEFDDALITSLKDKTLNLRAWVWTPEKDRDGNELPVEARKAYQQTKVVKEFKAAKAESNSPF